MSLIIRTTFDGSNTLESSVFRSTFHSQFGAIQESQHVFIRAGLEYVLANSDPEAPIQIFEFGFGTGLNAWLTRLYAEQHGIYVQYYAVEQFPVPIPIAAQLNYPTMLNHQKRQDFLALHKAEWDCTISFSPLFSMHKISGNGLELGHHAGPYHLIYYDAFGPESQPELWSVSALQKMTKPLTEGGVFVTYCAKGQVRRNLIQLGLDMERLPGPPGKREMLRGVKRLSPS